MSAPSFSSFPVSFSSFPNIDPGPSNRQSETPKPESEKKRKHERSSRNKEKDRRKGRSKSRDREERKDRERSRERSRKKDKEREPERSRERRKERDKGKEKERDGERKSKHRHRDREDKDKSTLSLASEVGEDQNFELDLKKHNESYRLYFIDTKGDPLTLQYGGLYAGDLPRYRLHRGGRQVLGLSNSWIVYHRSGNGVEVGLKGTQKLTGLSDSSTRSLLALTPKPLLPSTAPSSKYEEIDGVIRLPTRRGRRDPEDSYRAITTSRDADSDSDSSSNSAEGESEEDNSDFTPTLSSQQLTIKTLEQELSGNPAAVDKWLSLLNHTLSTIPITSRNANKARSEITVSVLSRALSADPRNSSSKLLQLRYMKAGEEIWPEGKLKAEWEKALKVGGIEIWMEWLEWRIRSCTKGMEGLTEDVLQVYATLEGDSSEIGRLRVFWRMAVAFKAAGFTEKAMAMFQAQAELTFKVPQNLASAPFEDRLVNLEEFWDSENARVGEEGARGWNKWHASGKPDATATTTSGTALTRRDSESTTQLDPYRQWAFQETRRDLSCLLPAKSFDELAEADPYSTVLFSDIRMFLFEIKDANTRSALRLAWLSFLGLHIPGFASSLTTDGEVNWDDRWNRGYLTNSSHLDAVFPSESSQKLVTTGAAAAGVVVGREKEYANSFEIPVREWQRGVMGCLDVAVNMSKELRNWWSQEDVAGIDVLVVRRIFAQLRMGNKDVAWDELALAFESAVNLKNALKLSRSLVSTAQDSLLHWAAHAQLERMRGRLDESRKVYQTVLIGSKPARTAAGFPILWWNWAELEWLAGNNEQSMNVILSSVDSGDSRRSGVAVLRAKRGLEDAVEALAQSPWKNDEVKIKEREAWIKLRALLEILSGNDVVSMLQVFDKYLGLDVRGEAQHESLVVTSLVLIYRYGVILKNPLSPGILRERASEGLKLYPSNSVILGIFLEGEKGQGVWGRVRELLGDDETGVGRVKDVARRVEEVWIAGWEKGRWKGEVERTRSGLARAVESERTRASPVIWRIYLEFEIRAGDYQKAKKILYRAIGECPLHKESYLLAFGVLRSVFTTQELNSLADVMVERGLRLGRGLDEVMEGWEMKDIEEQEREVSGSDDEIEYGAQELRRLMPY